MGIGSVFITPPLVGNVLPSKDSFDTILQTSLHNVTISKPYVLNLVSF
jgi:hypothetical protein